MATGERQPSYPPISSNQFEKKEQQAARFVSLMINLATPFTSRVVHIDNALLVQIAEQWMAQLDRSLDLFSKRDNEFMWAAFCLVDEAMLELLCKLCDSVVQHQQVQESYREHKLVMRLSAALAIQLPALKVCIEKIHFAASLRYKCNNESPSSQPPLAVKLSLIDEASDNGFAMLSHSSKQENSEEPIRSSLSSEDKRIAAHMPILSPVILNARPPWSDGAKSYMAEVQRHLVPPVASYPLMLYRVDPRYLDIDTVRVIDDVQKNLSPKTAAHVAVILALNVANTQDWTNTELVGDFEEKATQLLPQSDCIKFFVAKIWDMSTGKPCQQQEPNAQKLAATINNHFLHTVNG